MRLPIVHHPDYDAGLPAAHRFPMGKYTQLMQELRASGIATDENLRVPTPAPQSWFRMVHDPAYVDQVFACAVPPAIEREIGFPVGERVSRRAQMAVAGTVLATKLALEHGIACNTAGGSHHARRLQGAGFCTFNDVAVAASVLLSERLARRILVVDLDVHQGDGTAEIFAGEPRVFTFSMHAEKNYPARKAQSDLDIGLPDGLGDAEYLARLEAVLPILLAYARPDFVFYNAGVDPHRDDKLGKLALSDDGLRARDAAVVRFFRGRGTPVCCVIGGGYSNDVEALARRHAILFETAAELCA
jgi:acetoin utilization deacetylase AcuC-like enzyme